MCSFPYIRPISVYVRSYPPPFVHRGPRTLPQLAPLARLIDRRSVVRSSFLPNSRYVNALGGTLPHMVGRRGWQCTRLNLSHVSIQPSFSGFLTQGSQFSGYHIDELISRRSNFHFPCLDIFDMPTPPLSTFESTLWIKRMLKREIDALQMIRAQALQLSFTAGQAVEDHRNCWNCWKLEMG